MEYILQQHGSPFKVNDLHNSCKLLKFIKVSREPTLSLIPVVKSYFLYGIGNLVSVLIFVNSLMVFSIGICINIGFGCTVLYWYSTSDYLYSTGILFHIVRAVCT